jgi:hypothetical protein
LANVNAMQEPQVITLLENTEESNKIPNLLLVSPFTAGKM